MTWTSAKEATEALKNIATLILYLVIVLFFYYSVWPKIKDFEIKKVTVAGVELGPREKEAIKTVAAIQNSPVRQGKDTTKISQNIVLAAKIVDTLIGNNDRNWVYVGQMINGRLNNTHFKINEIPKRGQVIRAVNAVYKRKELPVELENGEWKLGDIRGIVADKESATIDKIVEIADNNFWALVH